MIRFGLSGPHSAGALWAQELARGYAKSAGQALDVVGRGHAPATFKMAHEGATQTHFASQIFSQPDLHAAKPYEVQARQPQRHRDASAC